MYAFCIMNRNLLKNQEPPEKTYWTGSIFSWDLIPQSALFQDIGSDHKHLSDLKGLFISSLEMGPQGYTWLLSLLPVVIFLANEIIYIYIYLTHIYAPLWWRNNFIPPFPLFLRFVTCWPDIQILAGKVQELVLVLTELKCMIFVYHNIYLFTSCLSG